VYRSLVITLSQEGSHFSLVDGYGDNPDSELSITFFASLEERLSILSR
jgi:hypothetical protein